MKHLLNTARTIIGNNTLVPIGIDGVIRVNSVGVVKDNDSAKLVVGDGVLIGHEIILNKDNWTFTLGPIVSEPVFMTLPSTKLWSFVQTFEGLISLGLTPENWDDLTKLLKNSKE